MQTLATIPNTAELAPTSLGREERIAGTIAIWLANRAETTIRAYRRDLEAWADWVGLPATEAVARLFSLDRGEANAHGMAYRAALIEAGLAPATVNRRLAALRSLTRAAETTGLVSWRLSVGSVRAKAYRDTRGPGVDGYRALVATLNPDTLRGKRDRALLSMLFAMALRRAEVIGLDLADIDLVEGRAWIVGKGSREREAVSIPGPVRDLLRSWIEVRGLQPGPLFVSLDRRHGSELVRPSLNAVTRLVREIGRRADVRVTPHALRHSGITRALDVTGGDARRVRALSRHAKLETLMLYDDARRDEAGAVAELVALDV